METYDRKIRALPELIRALEECDGGGNNCAVCAYNDVGDGCGNVLEMDALFWLKELSSRLDLAKGGRLELARRCRELEEKLERAEAEVVKVETSFYDQEEVFHNCTVQVLTNTATGDVSVGWWRNG